MVCIKLNDADIQTFFSEMRLRYSCAANQKASSTNWMASSTNWKASSKNWKVSSKGFFRRALGSYTHKFLKRDAASLMDLLELHLYQQNRPVMEMVSANMHHFY